MPFASPPPGGKKPDANAYGITRFQYEPSRVDVIRGYGRDGSVSVAGRKSDPSGIRTSTLRTAGRSACSSRSAIAPARAASAARPVTDQTRPIAARPCQATTCAVTPSTAPGTVGRERLRLEPAGCVALRQLAARRASSTAAARPGVSRVSALRSR